jgi:hypothetical protein
MRTLDLHPVARLWLALACLCGMTLGCSSSDFSGSGSRKSATKQDTEDDAEEADDEDGADGPDDGVDAPDGDSGDDDDDDDEIGSTDSGADDGDILSEEESLSCDKGKPGLVGKLYQLPVGTDKLPDFKALTPLGQVDALQLNVPEREWTQGFPGAQNLVEWFGIEFFGELNVPEDGSYEFRTHSDDGSRLFISDALVVDNDGKHGPTSKNGTKQLEKGKRKIKVEWFQGPRTKIALQVYWKKPGGTEEIIPASVLTRNKDCSLQDLGKFE